MCEYSCVVQSDPVKNFAFVNNVCVFVFFLHVCVGVQHKPFVFIGTCGCIVKFMVCVM